MSIIYSDPLSSVLARYEASLGGKDMEKIYRKEQVQSKRVIRVLARRIIELVLPRAEKREEMEKKQQQEKAKRADHQAQQKRQTKLMLLKKSGTNDEKILTMMKEEDLYCLLFVLYTRAPLIKEKYRSRLEDAIRRTISIAQLQGFASEYEAVCDLLQCIPPEIRAMKIEAMQANTNKMFEKMK